MHVSVCLPLVVRAVVSVSVQRKSWFEVLETSDVPLQASGSTPEYALRRIEDQEVGQG